MRARAAGAWTLALGAFVACRGSEAPPSEQGAPAAPVAEAPPPPDSSAGLGADTTGWTIGTSARASTIAEGVPILAAMRKGTHEGFERVTLELGGEGSGFPAYHISYIDRPLFECGSGRQIQPVGDAWLELRMEPVDAHTPEGLPTVPHAPQDVPGMENLLRTYLTCDFEAVTTIVLAVRHPNHFRANTLDGPRRIIVDVLSGADAPPP